LLALYFTAHLNSSKLVEPDWGIGMQAGSTSFVDKLRLLSTRQKLLASFMGIVVAFCSCSFLFSLVSAGRNASAPEVPLEELVKTSMAEILLTNSAVETRTALSATPTPAFTPSETASATLTPTEDLAQIPARAEASCVPTNTERVMAHVVAIVDGDSITVEINGQVFDLRYIGIDTAERGQPYGAEASSLNASLVANKTVLLVKDVSEVDQFGRLLRYVFAGEYFVNYELVRQGAGRASDYPPDSACAATFQQAQIQAMSVGLGFWVPTSTPQPGQPTQSANCDPSYPTVCIPPPPPDLDCPDITYKNFTVIGADPHRFDGSDNDGVGCEG